MDSNGGTDTGAAFGEIKVVVRVRVLVSKLMDDEVKILLEATPGTDSLSWPALAKSTLV